jgi:hypothetical protein
MAENLGARRLPGQATAHHNPYGYTMWMAGGGVKGRNDVRRHR